MNNASNLRYPSSATDKTHKCDKSYSSITSKYEWKKTLRVTHLILHVIRGNEDKSEGFELLAIRSLSIQDNHRVY